MAFQAGSGTEYEEQAEPEQEGAERCAERHELRGRGLVGRPESLERRRHEDQDGVGEPDRRSHCEEPSDERQDKSPVFERVEIAWPPSDDDRREQGSREEGPSPEAH